MGSWLSAIQRCRTTDDDGRGLQDRDAGRHVLVDVSPLLSGKEDDKRDIDVLLMGNRVGRLPRHARLVAAGAFDGVSAGGDGRCLIRLRP
jgi:hypothetical protein